MGFSSEDEQFMRQAIRLSREGTGYTEPNPLVGALLVHNGNILSGGFHSRFGALHAEREALKAENIPPGTTLYVTLEPCLHFGKTPPCRDIIVEKQVSRVVVATVDPNPLVSGKGLDALREAGVRVEVGCLAKEAQWVNRHYLTYMSLRRPHLVIKAGVSADGKLSDAKQDSRWVTSEELRRVANDFRGEFSAILVGSGTILADDPLLTIRSNQWPEKRFWRIVLDGRARLSSSHFLQTASEQYPILWVVSSNSNSSVPIRQPHLTILSLQEGLQGGIDLNALMSALHEIGIASVIIEGGPTIFDSFLNAGLVDEMVLFTAPSLLGGQKALTIYPSGRSVDNPIQLKDYSVLELTSGWIVCGRL